MQFIKKTLKYTSFLFGSIILYLLTAILVSKISVNNDVTHSENDKTIYLTTNGIHASVIIHKQLVSEEIKRGLATTGHHNFYMFGWGNEDFYINTPTWDDFKFKYAFNAFFMNTGTAIHLTTYKQTQQDWIAVKCSSKELKHLNSYIFKTFKINKEGEKQRILCDSYSSNDSFYRANGTYSIYRTCNTWINNGFKEIGLKASLWTIFDFGLLQKYK